MVAPADLTVTELCLAYYRHAESYYVRNGRPTSEVCNVRTALKPLRRLYGPTRARDFGPLAMKAVREESIRAGLCRREVNRRTQHVVRCFRWAVENELVSPSVHHGLKAVAGLRKGRSEARESEPVRPVPDDAVDAIRPHVSRQVWAMIELQRLTGARPGEVCIMRSCDLDTSGRVWCYRPAEHKTEHHGRDRVPYLGPKAQAIAREWLRTDLAAYLFSPAEAMAERKAARRASRKSPVQPSQVNRAKARPENPPGDRYTVDSYRRAIAYGCRRAGILRWHPNQLRHSAATRLRKEFGIEAARVVLGHGTLTVTEVYAEVDGDNAREIMARVG